MIDMFYRAFEERYYAPRHVIRQLRQQYLSFVEPLKAIYPGTSTFDIGCGRGEWLELMLEAGFQPLGVDLDEGMLQACQELHLPAHLGDAVVHLASLPDSSHAVITAFHLVEHISFDQLTEVVIQALRVLKPGGLLIMETPNPENIVVGTRNFYLDPTHQRPIPSLLLSFLTEHYGYARTKVLRLQENRDLLKCTTLGLHNVFDGVSPDYAVVAQKGASPSVLEPFDDAFSREYGLSLEVLSSHYDAGIRGPIERLDRRLRELEIQLKTEATELRECFKQAKQDAQVAETALQTVYASSSWRYTAPIRWLNSQARLLRSHGLQARLQSLQRKFWRAPMSAPPPPAVKRTDEHSEADPRFSEYANAPLSARADEVYKELQSNLNQQKK